MKCERCGGEPERTCVCQGPVIAFEGIGGQAWLNHTPFGFVQAVRKSARGLTDEQVRQLILCLQKDLSNR